ncbi:putative glycosyltransferase EpsJ [Lachnospiraceae bacterium]|nr:putative glycosyltransferase EpsJ [Lachnospiraceae bacterium]
MDNVGISVIMPSLNVGEYIEECLCSVLSQSYQDIEVLVIDAGSTDGTKEIILKYAQLDSRIKLIHSVKKSYGYQMNLGIESAKGRYIAIVETDDILAERIYEKLLLIAEETDADFVKGFPELFWGNYQEAVWTSNTLSFFDGIDQRIHGNQIVIWPKDMPELLQRDLFLWTGIYKRKFIQKIRFNETQGAAFQDQGVLLKILSQAAKGVYINSLSYKYRQTNPNSSIVNPKGLMYLVNEYKANEDYVKQLSPAWQKAFYRRLWIQCIERFRCMARERKFWHSELCYMKELKEMLALQWEQGIIQEAYCEKYEVNTYRLFCQKPEMLYQEYVHYYQKYIELLQQLDRFLWKKTIIIFGCGNIGKFLHLICELRMPGQVEAYCDNSHKRIGTKVQGLTVYSPKQAVKIFKECIFAIAGKRYEAEMRRQLDSLGIPDTRIYVYTGGIELELLKIK